MTTQGNPMIGYVIGGAIAALILLFRMRQMSRTRKLRLETLWIPPAILLAVSILVLVETPPVGPGWLVVAFALIVGAGVGWQRGRSMHIAVDPETHRLDQKASPLTYLLLLGLIGLKIGLRSCADANSASHETAIMITDSLVLLAFGMFSVTRLEMFLRARRLLRDARAANPLPTSR
jgi:hypothetical protein